MAIDRAHAFFPYASKGRPESDCTHLGRTTVYINVLLQICLNFPTLRYNIAQRDLGHLDSADYHIDYYMSDIRSDEYEVVNALGCLDERHALQKMGAKSCKVSGTSHFSDISSGAWCAETSPPKEKLSYFIYISRL